MNYARNVQLIWAYNFFHGLLFFLPIFSVYLRDELSSVFIVTVILALLVAVTIISEVPAGAITDRIGRRKSLLLSSILSIVALLSLYIGSLIPILVFTVFQGLAKSFMSGTDSSLLYDSLLVENQSAKYKYSEGIANALWPLGAALGSLIGGVLASISFELTILVTCIPLAITVFIALALIEPPIHKEETFSLRQQIHSSIQIIQKNSQVILLMLGALFLFASSEVVHELKPVFFEMKALPVEAFGLFMALTFILSSAGSYISDYVSKRVGDKRTLVLCAAAMGALIFASTLNAGYLAGALVVSASLFWGISIPVRLHMLNAHLPSNKRTTILSVSSLVSSVGFLLAILLVGRIADAFSVNVGFQVTAFFALGAVIMYALLQKD